MISLRLAPHTRVDDTIVEIWRDDAMIGVIYPSPKGIKLLSKFLTRYRSEGYHVTDSGIRTVDGRVVGELLIDFEEK